MWPDALSALDLAGPWSVDPIHAPRLARLLAGQAGDRQQVPTPKAALPVTEYTPNQFKQGKRIAVLNLSGYLTKGRSYFGTSTAQLLAELAQAVADPTVSGVLLAVESPGGSVAGTQELAAAVRAARSKKPVWAQVQDLTASAAYRIASQADQIWANQPTAMIGSIGTIMSVLDVSAALEKDGVKVHTIATGELKAAGNFGVPFTPEMREMLQQIVDEMQAQFDAEVMTARGLSPEQLAEVKRGGIYTATRAKTLKLIDGIRPPDATLKALSAAR